MTFPGAASPRTTRFASAATTSCLYGSGMAGGWRAGVYLALILHLDVQVKRSRRLRRQTLERRGGSALWRTGFCFASARIAARGRVSSRAKGCAAISPLSNVRAPLSLQRGTGAHRNTQFHIIDCALCPSLESGAFAGWHLTAPSFVPSPLPTRVAAALATKLQRGRRQRPSGAALVLSVVLFLFGSLVFGRAPARADAAVAPPSPQATAAAFDHRRWSEVRSTPAPSSRAAQTIRPRCSEPCDSHPPLLTRPPQPPKTMW